MDETAREVAEFKDRLQEDVLKKIRAHYSEAAADAFRAAVIDSLRQKKAGWKKSYRKI